jgi:hypothetical protein
MTTDSGTNAVPEENRIPALADSGISKKAWRGLPNPIETAADMLAEAHAQPALQSELRKTLRAIFTPAEFDAVVKRAAEIERNQMKAATAASRTSTSDLTDVNVASTPHLTESDAALPQQGAERRAGELLRDMEKNKGVSERKSDHRSIGATGDKPTLSDLGKYMR